jgi:hypothetical protein
VTLRNDGLNDIEGDVVLVPRPPPPPGSPRGPFDQLVPGAPTGSGFVAAVALLEPVLPPAGNRPGIQVVPPQVYTDPDGAPRTPPAAPQAWPTYRVAVSLAAGGQKALGIVVLEAPYGYGAELRDRAGRPIATQPARTGGAVGREHWAVALLGRTGGSDLLTTAAVGRPHLSDLVCAASTSDKATGPTGTQPCANTNLTRFDTGSDFPDDPRALLGLHAVVIADLDTGVLRPTQVRALETFVGLGGSLLLTGGPGAQRRLGPFPDELVPLRPTSTAAVTLDGPAAATATVATGRITSGRVAARAADGTPLIVEGSYGSGRVEQLTYDPFGQPFASDLALGAASLEAGLAPALDRLKRNPFSASPEGLWWPLLDQPPASRPGRRWPGWSIALLGAYVFLLGPMTYLGARRRRRDLAWAAIPVAAVVLLGITGFANPAKNSAPDLIDNVVEVDNLGPGGTSMVTTYHGLVEPHPSHHQKQLTLRAPPGAAVSSVIARPVPISTGDASSAFAFGQPPATRPGGQLPVAPPGSVAPGAGGEVTTTGDGTSELRTGPRAAGEERTMQTLAITSGQGGIEATITVSGSPEAKNWRISGTVTNSTGQRVRSPSLWVKAEGDGRTGIGRLNALEPGAAVPFDVPLAPVDATAPVAGGRDEQAVAGAATLAGTGPGQVLLVGLADPQAPKDGARPTGTKVKLVMKVVTAGP